MCFFFHPETRLIDADRRWRGRGSDGPLIFTEWKVLIREFKNGSLTRIYCSAGENNTLFQTFITSLQWGSNVVVFYYNFKAHYSSDFLILFTLQILFSVNNFVDICERWDPSSSRNRKGWCFAISFKMIIVCILSGN